MRACIWPRMCAFIWRQLCACIWLGMCASIWLQMFASVWFRLCSRLFQMFHFLGFHACSEFPGTLDFSDVPLFPDIMIFLDFQIPPQCFGCPHLRIQKLWRPTYSFEIFLGCGVSAAPRLLLWSTHMGGGCSKFRINREAEVRLSLISGRSNVTTREFQETHIRYGSGHPKPARWMDKS